MKILNGMDEVRAAVGEHLGWSDWRAVTQVDIDAFAALTGDDQWIHVDVERATRESPFGGTIAHGNLTLVLGPSLARTVYRIDGMKLGVNAGFGKIRFLSPVKAGARIRLGVTIAAVDEVKGGNQVTITFTTEVEGAERPACVADMLLRYPDAA